MKRLLQFSMLIVSIFIAMNACAQDADTALALLKEGNARFVAMKVEHPNISVERRAQGMAGKGTLKIVSAVYDLKTGAVEWL